MSYFMMITSMLLFLILFLLEISQTSSNNYEVSGRCVVPAVGDGRRLIDNVCASFVDYPYFVPESAAESDLDRAARKLVDDYRLYLLSKSCMVDHLLNACNSVYLRCGSNFETYNGDNKVVKIKDSTDYIALPCARTCKSIKKSCFGYLEYLYYTYTNSNCSLTISDYYKLVYDGISSRILPAPNLFSYSGINLFNDQSTCDGGSSGDIGRVEIADLVEEYRPVSNPAYNNFILDMKTLMKVDYPSDANYKGICYDVSTTTHIPPHQYIISKSAIPSIFQQHVSKIKDGALAPLRAPYLAQAFLEVSVYDFMQYQVPGWVDSSCYDSIRILVCKSVMQNSRPFQNSDFWSVIRLFNQTKNKRPVDGTGIAALSYDLPRYAARDDCYQAMNKCGAYNLFRSKRLPKLLPEICNSTSKNAYEQVIYNFPEKKQTVYNFRVQNAEMQLSFDLLYKTDPNNETSLFPNAKGYGPICPDEFVLIKDVGLIFDESTLKVFGSSCSFACLTNLWNANEWIVSKFFIIFFSIIATLVGLYIAMIQMLQEKSKSFIYVIYSSSLTLMSTAIFLSFAITPEKAFCKSEVSRETFGLNFCTFQSAIVIFSILNAAICWALMNLDIYLKIKWQVLAVRHIRALTIVVVIIVSVGLMGLSIYFKLLGYREGYAFCLFGDKTDPRTSNLVILVPVFVLHVFGWIGWFSMAAMYTKHRQASITDQSYVIYVHIVKVIRYHRQHLLVMFAGEMMWLTLILVLFIEAIGHVEMTQSISKWTHCVFNQFERNNQLGWIDICGIRPTFYISNGAMTWLTLLLACQPILMFIIYYDFLIDTGRRWFIELKYILTSNYDDIMTADVEATVKEEIEKNKTQDDFSYRTSKLIDSCFDKIIDFIYGTDTGEENHDVGRPRLLTIVLASDEKFAGILVQRRKRQARVGISAVRAVARNSIFAKRKVDDVFAAHQKSHNHNRGNHHGAIVPFESTVDVSNFEVDIKHASKEQIDSFVKKDQEANEMADLFMSMVPSTPSSSNTQQNIFTSSDVVDDHQGSNSNLPTNNDAVSRKIIIFC